LQKIHNTKIESFLFILGLQTKSTGYGPGGGEIFRTCPDRPWNPPSVLYNGYRDFPGGKERPRRDADPSLPSNDLVMKEYSYIYTPPRGRKACTQPQCLYKCALYLYLYKPNRDHVASLLRLLDHCTVRNPHTHTR
jgi:hypothetical protein